MKKKNFLIAAAALLLTACGADPIDWCEPSPAKDGCQQVHFACQDMKGVTLNFDDPQARTVNLTIERERAEGALTVDIVAEQLYVTDKQGQVVECGALTLPAQATFEDGSRTAVAQVSVPQDAVDGAKYKYHLTIVGDEVDPYGKYEHEGGSQFVGSINVLSSPKTATLRFTQYGSYFGDDYKQMYRVTGANTYLLSNFLNSGVDVSVTVDRTTGQVTLEEENSYVYEGYWYFCDADGYYNGCYPNYQEGVQDNYLNSFYVCDDADYTAWDEQAQALLLGSYFSLNDDYTNSYYDEVYIYFGDVPARPGEKTWTASGNFYYDYTPDDFANGGLMGAFGDNFSMKAKVEGDVITLRNFLESGTDLIVTVDRTAGTVTNLTYGEVSDDYPNGNKMYVSDGYYTPYDWDAGSYVYFYPNKSSASNWINYASFYIGDGYSSWDEEYQTLWLGAYWYLNEDTENSCWDTLWLTISEDGTEAKASVRPAAKAKRKQMPRRPAGQPKRK